MKSTRQIHIGRMIVLTLALIGALATWVQAEVRLPQVFGSHMVLQQEKPLVVWGMGAAGRKRHREVPL